MSFGSDLDRYLLTDPREFRETETCFRGNEHLVGNWRDYDCPVCGYHGCLDCDDPPCCEYEGCGNRVCPDCAVDVGFHLTVHRQCEEAYREEEEATRIAGEAA